MESTPDTGVVVSANWVCSGEQSEVKTSISGSCAFPEPEAEFIPYYDLTQEQVLNWCWTDGGVDKQITEDSVMHALEQSINPPTILQSLPWA